MQKILSTLFFISSEDRKKKKNLEGLELHQGRLGLEMEEQVLVERCKTFRRITKEIMKSPSFEFLNECDRRESTWWIGLVICLGWPSRGFSVGQIDPPGAPLPLC